MNEKDFDAGLRQALAGQHLVERGAAELDCLQDLDVALRAGRMHPFPRCTNFLKGEEAYAKPR